MNSFLNKAKRKAVTALAALCCVSLVACAAPQGSASAAPVPSAETPAIQFTDDDGRKIRLDAPCGRIISLYSAHTENLYEIGAGDKLIGVYTGSIYPPEAALLPAFDYKGDPEQVIAAQPDLVLIRPFITRNAPDYIAQLESAGIPVVSLYPDSYDRFSDYIKTLAALTGAEEAARRRLAEFYAAIDGVTAITAQATDKKTVFMEATEVELRTVTPDSMPGRAIAFAGGVNLAADAQPVERGSSIAAFGIERVLENAERIDVYVSQRGAMNAGGNLISISERDGFDTVKAVRENRVYLITDKLINSPTFRFQKGIAEMARFLYPELMDDLSAFKNDDPATRRGYAELLTRALHLPVYVPSSSKYYETAQKGHTFGRFEDVRWYGDGFDPIETAVFGGYIDWEKAPDGKEYFYPEQPVTREALAKTVFLIGDFSPTANTPIADIDRCGQPRIVHTLVDLGIFTLEDGRFNPGRAVTNNEILAAVQAVLAA